jgi:hypothetical protein
MAEPTSTGPPSGPSGDRSTPPAQAGPGGPSISTGSNRRRVLLSFWVPALALIGIGIALLEFFYSQAPVPPGVDPGHWITSGYFYVGHARPPYIAVGSPYVYPPIAPAFTGFVFVVVGDPLTAGFVEGGVLLLLYGLSLAWVAWHLLDHNAVRLGFVGFGVFAGTTFSMLFWGAYPNFLGLTFLNLLLVAEWRFLTRRSVLDGLLLGGLLGSIYLTHTLVFVIAGAGVVFAGTLLFISLGPRALWEKVASYPFVASLLSLVAIVGGYIAFLRGSSVAPPSYLGNPSSFTLTGLGQLFVPLASAPAFLPPGPPTYLSAPVVLAALFAGIIALVGFTLAYRTLFGRSAETRWFVAAGALVAALALPAAGWEAHLSTDYTRFVYFLPEPVVLVGAVITDSLYSRRAPSPSAPESHAPGVRIRAARRRAAWVPYVIVAAVVALLIINVTFPTGAANEASDTGASHSALFLAAEDWISSQPAAGNVLTIQSAARWTEALTSRGAFDPGPTWLDFESWQIADADASFWALNSANVVTSNGTVLSYSPPGVTALDQSPMYSVYVDGVVVPVVRLVPGEMSVTLVSNGSTRQISGADWGAPSFSLDPLSGDSLATYHTGRFTVNVSARLVPGGATLSLAAAPTPGNQIGSLTVAFATPPRNAASLGPAVTLTLGPLAGGVYWNVSKSIGPLPTPSLVPTAIRFSPTPQSLATTSFPVNGTLLANFSNPSPGAPIQVESTLQTQVTTNSVVTLPRLMATSAFLAVNDIHFVLLPATNPYSANAILFEAAYGFQVEFQNSQWMVLQG